jgi:hypothetical protein
MIVRYSYISWNPPRLAPAEAIELGRQIALQGREPFIREFRKSLAKPTPQQQRNSFKTWPAPARYALLIAVLALCLFGLVSMPAREWGRLVLLMAMVMGIYGVSAWLAYRRFSKWVDYLIANYAAHIAKRDQ